MNHDFYDWLDEHCAEYGFIKRYPTRKVLLTGWDEPWHYRYVGKEAAQFIMKNGICFEEFYAHYNRELHAVRVSARNILHGGKKFLQYTRQWYYYIVRIMVMSE